MRLQAHRLRSRVLADTLAMAPLRIWAVLLAGAAICGPGPALRAPCRAQLPFNLVPNPSFEERDTCPFEYDPILNPYGNGLICKAPPWFQPLEPHPVYCHGSTNYMHVCAGSVPVYECGYQWPRSGEGMAFAFIWNTNIYNQGREYF